MVLLHCPLETSSAVVYCSKETTIAHSDRSAAYVKPQEHHHIELDAAMLCWAPLVNLEQRIVEFSEVVQNRRCALIPVSMPEFSDDNQFPDSILYMG